MSSWSNTFRNHKFCGCHALCPLWHWWLVKGYETFLRFRTCLLFLPCLYLICAGFVLLWAGYFAAKDFVESTCSLHTNLISKHVQSWHPIVVCKKLKSFRNNAPCVCSWCLFTLVLQITRFVFSRQWMSVIGGAKRSNLPHFTHHALQQLCCTWYHFLFNTFSLFFFLFLSCFQPQFYAVMQWYRFLTGPCKRPCPRSD